MAKYCQKRCRGEMDFWTQVDIFGWLMEYVFGSDFCEFDLIDDVVCLNISDSDGLLKILIDSNEKGGKLSRIRCMRVSISGKVSSYLSRIDCAKLIYHGIRFYKKCDNEDEYNVYEAVGDLICEGGGVMLICRPDKERRYCL